MHRLSALLCVLLLATGLRAQVFDFTRPDDCRGWQPTHDVSSLAPSADGLVITITGDDPYINGPARDYPPGQLLWMTAKLRSEQDGMAQVFWFDRGPSEEQSVRFPVRSGQWEEIRLPVPALGPKFRLRFDPPGTGGKVTLARLAFEPRVSLRTPAWNAADLLKPQEAWPAVRAGDTLIQHGPGLGEFIIRCGGKTMASGFANAQIGYVHGDQPRWLDLKAAKATVKADEKGLVATAAIADADGANWRIEQRFTPTIHAGAIDVSTSISVDRARDVAFLPMLVLFPGAGSFGQGKTQALFPGLEYLDKDEPSSSEADIIGPGSKRQTPDSLKITMPLMAVVADGAYVALAWRPQPQIAALFDSPDCFFKSGGHVMGLLYPGSNGNDRVEGSLLPHGPVAMSPGKPVTVQVTIFAGVGTSAVDAVKQYVKMTGLPELPDAKMDLQGFTRLMATGWLDSEAREGPHYRHAWPGQFPPQTAGDAAWMMDWLAASTTDAALAKRLKQAAGETLAEVKPQSYNTSGVSHVRYPVGSLLYGHVAENAARARDTARDMLKRFEPDGTLLYRPGKVDYGKTHFAKDANGHTAQAVAAILEHATVCGDRELIEQSLWLLRAMDKFSGSAPRGAQTWECPLHTPDILASAHLVKAYTIGYELTRDEKLLETARYWAWTGVPFVYLVNPAGRDVGSYATIAVYGATSWVAPNWMGLPVQWCGLVYADALYRLHKHDAAGPWKTLADGIVISGIQQTFPVGVSRQGLLPDSYILRAGLRQNPAINPGTVQAPAMRLFARPIYDFASLRQPGLLIHAPGQLTDLRETPKQASFKITGTIRPEYRVLISGCRAQPAIKVNGSPADVQWIADSRWAIVTIKGDASVTVDVP